jgi:putative Holliday junction resolvase
MTSRVLGVDLGTRRIGLALSDPLRVTASPLATIERGRSATDDLAAIVSAAMEHGVGQIVVGIPRSLSGRDGPAERAARDEIALLERLAPDGVTVSAIDERFTTVIAHDTLARSGVKAKQRRGRVDQVAAAVILQSWLDGQR